jgi:RNA polymerase sigma-70 factor (ECF subfamily)
LLSAEELLIQIQGCTLNNRDSQKIVFSSFYGYAMSICFRYTNNKEDASEILNDGFLKIFKEIYRFTPAYTDVIISFKGWIRRILVCAAIDHYRKFHKHEMNTSNNGVMVDVPDIEENALDKISYNEILMAIQKLSPAYRTILNLYIIEGFTHFEISKKLGITIGTSKSNLSKAKIQLQKILFYSRQTVLINNET